MQADDRDRAKTEIEQTPALADERGAQPLTFDRFVGCTETPVEQFIRIIAKIARDAFDLSLHDQRFCGMVAQIEIGARFFCPVTIAERWRAGVDDASGKIIIRADRPRPHVAPFRADPQVERTKALRIIGAEIGEAVALCLEPVGEGKGAGQVEGGHVQM